MRRSHLLLMGGALGQSFCLWALVGPFPWALVGPFPWALVGSFPWAFVQPFPRVLVGPFSTEKSEARSKRSDKVCGCKLHITQTKECTSHRLQLAHDTD